MRKYINIMENIEETFSEKVENELDSMMKRTGLDKFSHVNFFEMSPIDLEVTHIGVNAEHRGKGFGNRLMDYLTNLADKYSVTLYLSPATDANPEEGLGYEDLRAWYESWNFERMSGRDLMKREPDND